MTTLMEEAVERLRALSDDRQNDLARTIMMLTEDGEDDLTPQDIVAIQKSRAAAARGEFATEDEVRTVWAKHGL